MDTSLPVDFILVEDNSNDAEMVLRSMRKRYPQLSHRWLKDGAEALAFLLPEADSPGSAVLSARLLLLDLKLPLVDGFEVLTRIKASPSLRSLPVVIMSSSREETDLARCYKSGANSYIVKPVSYAEFDSAVGQIGAYWLQLNQTLLGAQNL